MYLILHFESLSMTKLPLYESTLFKYMSVCINTWTVHKFIQKVPLIFDSGIITFIKEKVWKSQLFIVYNFKIYYINL